jgi:phage gp46-like protein
MAKSWDIDPKKRDYVLEKGAPRQTDSLTIPAYIRLKTRRLRWMYAPDNSYGSDFYTIKKRKSTDDASAIEAIAARALQPIADDGRASAIQIDTTVATRSGVGLQAKITDASGEPQTLDLPAI